MRAAELLLYIDCASIPLDMQTDRCMPFLLQCNNYCNSRGCTGYFVTREGHCSHCPEGAAACSDLTGEVRECRSGLGLVGGECRPCKVDGCQKCDGERPGTPAMRVGMQPALAQCPTALMLMVNSPVLQAPPR